MKVLSLGYKALSLILCVSFAGALFTSCKKGDDRFPPIVTQEEQEETVESSDASIKPDSGKDIRQLQVALPYSDLTIQCLSAMFYCKNNGLWESSETGLTIDTDALSSVATNYVVTNIECSSTGAGLEQVASWKSEGNMPDLFLAEDSSAIYKAGYSTELNSYLADDIYLNSRQVYSGAFTSDSEGGVYYAVPHFCSARIILGNTDYIPTKMGKLPAKNTTANLREYLVAIKNEYKSVSGFASAYQMIPYLGSAFNSDIPTSYMVNEEYKNDKASSKEVINDATSYIKGLYSSSLAQDQIGGADSIYSRKAALWVDSSANIRTWADYYPGSLYLLHLPCSDATNEGVPYISTYSLCVSKDSSNSAFAAEFATFISFDPDAQLLIYRLENMSGLMPLTRNAALWDFICQDEIFGYMAEDFRQVMDNAVYCPNSFDDMMFAKTNEYIAEYAKRLGEFDPEKCYG